MSIDELRDALSDRYDVLREIGRGGWATVYLALDRNHGREVAIKVLDLEKTSEKDAERFRSEIRTAARLQHPNILPLYDSGVAAGRLYYTAPYVRGESLNHKLARESQLPVEVAIRLGREVAEALAYAHREGVVHRDIKPSNILLSDGHAIVADFGIARALDPLVEPLTTTGVVVGTTAYMSPEQLSGQRLDGRTDIYSLGLTIYECLAGRPAFVGANTQSLTYQKLNTEPPPISATRSVVMPIVDDVLRRALRPLPADRYADADTFAATLSRLEKDSSDERRVATPVGPREASDPPSGGRGASRGARRWVAIAAGAILVAAALIALPNLLKRSGGSGSATAGVARDWVILADFDGPAEDPSLARSVREIVRSILDQSASVATLPDDQVRLGVAAAGMPDSTRVIGSIASAIARRGESRVVVQGVVRRVGADFSVILSAVDSYHDSVVISVGPTTATVTDLVAKTVDLSRGLRRRIEDRLADLHPGLSRKDVGPPVVQTRVFEAWRLGGESARLNAAGRPDSALRLIRQASALDPDFAEAWAGLGVCHLNMGYRDSARWELQEALKHSDRLTPVRRLRHEALLALIDGGPAAALPAYEDIVKLDPGNVGAHEILATLYSEVGDDERALEHVEAAERHAPFGGYPNAHFVKVDIFLALGRVEEAERVVDTEMAGMFQALARANVAAARADWSSADEILRHEGELKRAGGWSAYMQIDRACLAVARGDASAAPSLLAPAVAEARRKSDRALEFHADVTVHVAALLAGTRETAVPEDREASSGPRRIADGYRAVAGGRMEEARRMLDLARKSPSDANVSIESPSAVLEAWIAAKEDRWQDVIAAAGPLARQAGKDREFPAGRSLAAFLVGSAWEALGPPDSAVTYLEKAISPLGKGAGEMTARGLVAPYAHAHLVDSYARLNRREDAARHAAALHTEMDRADPSAGALIAQADRRLAAMK